jgi:ADP-dependent NAD(P)H-hydrate dehydratase / NAD(P)H-hydrate epimerase
MKIVKAQEMARIEQLAYAQGASEEEFMNRAGRGVAEFVQHRIATLHIQPKILLLCGSGNNAGDAYVAGRILLEGGFQVRALALSAFEQSRPLCQLQSKRFIASGGVITYLKEAHEIEFGDVQLLVDGILGTGFHGDVQGLMRALIEKANESQIPIVAIDIPSGINGTTGEIGTVAIRAHDTLFLGLPKTGCFFKEAWDYVGRIHVYDFGLGASFIDLAEPDYLLIDDPFIRSALPKIIRTRHKYQAGYVVGIGGCTGMPGAPIMSSFAALRSGAGIVRLLHPEGMEAELAAAPCELIREGFKEGDVKAIFHATSRASAVFIGPGMGTSSVTLKLLKRVLPELNKPCVIDAEALTLLAEHDSPLPPQTIMTPHHGEMKRLLHVEGELSFKELLEKSKLYALQKKITLVLKGAPTFVFHQGTTPFVCPRGDPGMATAGSGDVLTGIIAAFLAQTHDPLKAALLGVHFHALAGEKAAEKWTSYCMAATDITEALPLVFKEYVDTNR